MPSSSGEPVIPAAAARIRVIQADARYLAEKGVNALSFGFRPVMNPVGRPGAAFSNRHVAYGVDAEILEYGAWLP